MNLHLYHGYSKKISPFLGPVWPQKKGELKTERLQETWFCFVFKAILNLGDGPTSKYQLIRGGTDLRHVDLRLGKRLAYSWITTFQQWKIGPLVVSCVKSYPVMDYFNHEIRIPSFNQPGCLMESRVFGTWLTTSSIKLEAAKGDCFP